MKILIAGGPRVGKTRLATELERQHPGISVRHTDDLIATHSWSDASAEAARWMAEPGPWIIEGVAVPRALRKWLAAHPEGAPADVVHWGETPKEELSKGQASMAKGCLSVWLEVVSELRRRGVRIETF